MNRVGVASFAALIAAASPSAASAQQPLGFDCVRDSVELVPASGPWASLHATTVSKRLALVRSAGKWGAIADSLRLFFASAPADFSKLQPNDRDAIQLQLDSLRDELAEAERNPTALRLGKISDRFRLRFGMGPPVSYTLFNGRGATVVVSDSTDQTTRRSVCWLAFAAHDVTSQARLRSITDVAAALHRLDTRWSNFMNRGYSMLPHELLINGWTDALIKGLSRGNDLEPPRVQFIVAHPSAGTQVVSATLRTLRDSHREDVLSLEPAGFVVYSAQRSRYVGASWLVTFPSSSRIGSGVMLHVSRFGHVAYVRRPVDPDGIHRNGLLLSLDAYRYLTGAAGMWKNLEAAALAAYERAEIVRRNWQRN